MTTPSTQTEAADALWEGIVSALAEFVRAAVAAEREALAALAAGLKEDAEVKLEANAAGGWPEVNLAFHRGEASAAETLMAAVRAREG